MALLPAAKLAQLHLQMELQPITFAKEKDVLASHCIFLIHETVEFIEQNLAPLIGQVPLGKFVAYRRNTLVVVSYPAVIVVNTRTPLCQVFLNQTDLLPLPKLRQESEFHLLRTIGNIRHTSAAADREAVFRLTITPESAFPAVEIVVEVRTNADFCACFRMIINSCGGISAGTIGKTDLPPVRLAALLR